MSTEEHRASQPISSTSTPSSAVFLSYASEDIAAAERIAMALRSGGIEVWFDKSELRGGDAWDRQIRKQIHDCALFLPIISAQSDARHEGYFRREWRLAVERAGDMAEDVPFLLPVVVDNTQDATARVPDRFREVQWSHVPDGQVPQSLVERVQRLLCPLETHAPALTRRVSDPTSPVTRSKQSRAVWTGALAVVAAALLAGVLIYLSVRKPWVSKPAATSASIAANASPAGFSPPTHSIAVLPFVNMSGDKDQEYFSEGLTEELLDSLAKINQLQVAARTSSFSFEGQHPDITTIAHKLNVHAVLEGSVRRSANTVRITAQLIDGVTGFHLWSDSYDRSLGDILKLQTEIATAVASALKVTLLSDDAVKIEVGGTRNPAALDAYLRAFKLYYYGNEPGDLDTAIDGYTTAIRLDPNYALALSGRAIARLQRQQGGDINSAQTDARRAIALAPESGEAHLALAVVYEQLLDFRGATEEYEHAMALASGSERVLRHYGWFAVAMGHPEPGLAAARRAVIIDPLNYNAHGFLGGSLQYSRHFTEAIVATENAMQLAPHSRIPLAAYLGDAYYALGDYRKALSSCEADHESPERQSCLARVYDKLGRHADAESELKKYQVTQQGGQYQLATVYAQWGDRLRALQWLDNAMAVRDADLERLKTDPLLDPLRKEPRFQAIERALKFPD